MIATMHWRGGNQTLLLRLPLGWSCLRRCYRYGHRNHSCKQISFTYSTFLFLKTLSWENWLCHMEPAEAQPAKAWYASKSVTMVSAVQCPRELGFQQFCGRNQCRDRKCKESSHLAIQNNQFSGNLVPEIGLALQLVRIQADNNKFRGQLSRGFGRFSQLNFLYLQENMLDGSSIPDEIGSCKSLTIINLARNGLFQITSSPDRFPAISVS